MKTLMLFALFISSQTIAAHPSFLGKNAPLANDVQFIYEPYDRGSAGTCSHSIANANDPYDLTVSCIDGKGITHVFSVHLALSSYTHPTPPELSYELLYWVNDNGATTWFNFEKATALMSLESSQSLVGESAGLRLKIKLN